MGHKRKDETSVSVLLFGMAVGTVASTLLNTQKGQQVLHDARSLFDDFAVLMDHVLDDKVSFEEGIEGLSNFNNHLVDKLNRVKAFEQIPEAGVAFRMPSKVEQPDHAVVGGVRASGVSTSKSPISAFNYHAPVQPVKNAPRAQIPANQVQTKDDDVALLHKIGNRMFR